ncbi:uncharacterized protein LOC116344012 [Contarinia nasturtii]|uniref:uncharacterized protein LOC116344012 n=1 Tax=Contarinia nasturtii TaxID=265458 RepID=UPI0012D49C45|nr:uncharacterized protein LOC116344012 [Contarinia nasturtii]
MAYYGVFIPSEKKNAFIEEDAQLVFSDKIEAFKMLKKVRESRVKSFKTFEEAQRFSKCGLESPTETETPIIINAEVNGIPTNGNMNNNVNCDKNSAKASPVGEKPSSFRGPTSQELVKFRKMIEQGDRDSVQNLIRSNPRYLVSSGDTPTILKESFRYNALHQSAISKNAVIASLILETVGDPEFIKLLYGKDDDRTAEHVSNILLDLYLNTPEKGRSETPLHLAAKFGAVDVVEVLKSYRECESKKNAEGFLPKDIICSRASSVDPEVFKAIKTLLEGQFYVPVMRSFDNSMPPVIGEPFMETHLPNVPAEDLLSPKMEIRALAGPMNKEQAETFRKRWKTPPRSLGSPASYLKSPVNEHSPMNGSPLSSYPNSIVRQRSTPNKTPQKDATPTKSIEKTSRRLFDTSLNEDEPTVGQSTKKTLFKNYRSQSHDDSLNDTMIMTPTLHSLSDFSFNEHQCKSPGFRERHLKLADVDKGLEVIGRGLAKEIRITWREHWSFLDEFIDISSEDGLAKFEKYLQDRLDDRMKPPPSMSIHQRKLQLTPLPVTPISKISQKLNKLRIERDQDESFNGVRPSPPSSPSAFHAYLCVEKSCQIYANRLLKPISQNPTNIVTVNDVLVGELARLKSLICSYKHDIRFFGVDFQSTHSRFAHIFTALLNKDDECQKHKVSEALHSTLDHILQAKEKSANNTSKNGISQDEHAKQMTQLICLIKQLLRRLNDSSNIIPLEVLTSESDCVDIWHAEQKCECEWTNSPNNKLNRSIKRKHRLSEIFSDFCDKFNIKSDEMEIDDEEGDDTFWSLNNSDEDSNSDDDEYFTPPQSPLLEFFDDSDPKILYDNFIFGQEPTKMDNDVLKALHNVDIDRNSHPNIYHWQSALMTYSEQERASFPQPLNTTTANTKSPSPNKTFNRLPIKNILPRISQFHLKPSKFSAKD